MPFHISIANCNTSTKNCVPFFIQFLEHNHIWFNLFWFCFSLSKQIQITHKRLQCNPMNVQFSMFVCVTVQSKMHVLDVCSWVCARSHMCTKNSVFHCLLNHHCYSDINLLLLFFLHTFTPTAFERIIIETAKNIQILINLQLDI